MKCPKCGSEVSAAARFCTVCGARLDKGDGAAAAAAPEAASKAAPTAPAQALPPDQTISAPVQLPSDQVSVPAPAKRRDPRKVAVASLVVAALAVVVTCGAFIWKSASDRAAYDEAHRTYQVTLRIEAEGLDTRTGTKVPIRVSGTDFEGQKVEQTAYVGTGADLELMRGDYQLSVAASPISAQGTIYRVDGVGGKVSVSGGGAADGPELKLAAIPAAEVTDAQLDAALKAARDGGAPSADAAQKLRDAAAKRRDDGVAKKKADDAAAAQKKAAEEKAAAERAAAQNTATTPSYTFTVPAYWRGKVSLSVSGDEVRVTSKQAGEEILRLYIGGDDVPTGDIEAANLISAALGSGRYVYGFAVNYGYVIPSARKKTYASPDNVYTDAQARVLVDLQTGGAGSYDEALAGQSSNGGTSSDVTQKMSDYYTGAVQAGLRTR